MTTGEEARPNRAMVRCTKCREWRHRQQFKQRETGLYDYLCVGCRTKLNQQATIPARVRKKRTEQGLMFEARCAVLDERAAEKKYNAGKKLGTIFGKHGVKARQATWAATDRSIHLARKYMRDFPPTTDQRILMWREQMAALLDDARRMYKEESTERKLMRGGIHVWYDVLPGMKAKFVKLINEYPLGVAECPFTTM